VIVPSELAVAQALADPSRLKIVQALAQTELCTSHLQELLEAKQAVVSHHMKVLRDCGLVSTQPCGRLTYYRLRAGAFDALALLMSGLAAQSHLGPCERKACP
jgi:ArsR family transcriptional regulator, arsenate/arsenite/antimonite-responsive transcriptional repressor